MIVTETIKGKITKIKFYKDDFLIADINHKQVVKGNMPSPQLGLEYSFTGTWKKHPKYGDYFQFFDYESSYPKELDAIKSYLTENCKWIGPEISTKIVNTFGENAIQICKDDPNRVASEIKGVSSSRAREISAALRSNEAIEQLQISIKKLFVGLEVNRRVVGNIIKLYGEDAVAKIKENPYGLIEKVDGVGFIIADKIAQRCGFKFDDERRISAAIFYQLKDLAFSEGHTCYPRKFLLEKINCLTRVNPEKINPVIDKEIGNDLLVEYDGLIFSKRYFEKENYIATKLLNILNDETKIEFIENIEGLQSDQIDALHKSTSKVFILTGPPGTGKTFLIKHLLNVFQSSIIALAAPTGKAAKRMYELTGMMASTIHRLLEPQVESKEGSLKFTFQRDATNPIDADFVIIDETSMVDTDLMYSLIQAISDNSKIIFVGDTYQLPSVGPGNILKDMINAGLPCSELTIIKRQDAGLIIRNCHKIKNGENITINNNDSKDFYFVERDDELSIQKTILELVKDRLPKKYGVDPLKDIQILSPLRVKTDLSCKALNEKCQALLNPETLMEGMKFKLGDKVIQTKNEYDLNIINGDIGYVMDVSKEDQTITVEFENPERIVDVPLFGNNLDLAYCCTTHKYQGSEAPIIVAPIHRCLGSLVVQRNWLYTTVSRAQKVCVLVGQSDQVPKIIERNKQQRRFTGLQLFLSRARIEQSVLTALRILAGTCDGARSLDNTGFNRHDVEEGHRWAAKQSLDDNHLFRAKRMLWKYHRQIPRDLFVIIFGREYEEKTTKEEDHDNEESR